MEVGYVRVSKRKQNPELQRWELSAAGCEKIFEERITSREESHPQLEAALDYCREGDVLVVWRLDRLGRSIKELIELVNGLKDRGVGFRSLRESLNTTTPGGKLVFASIAEFERRRGDNRSPSLSEQRTREREENRGERAPQVSRLLRVG